MAFDFSSRLPVRVRVKFCGITRREDALAAIAAGVDAIGLVFFAPSPRAVTIAQAVEITACLPPLVTKVGLFVDAPTHQVEDTLRGVPLDLLQFHGDETPAECGRYEKPFIKAIRVREDTDLRDCEVAYADAAALLLDAHVDGVAGGTGQRFDWSLIPASLRKPLILAGGLTPDNVREAIARVQPYAVDVSGGIELAKGVKDPAKMHAFMEGVCNV